MVTCRDPGSTSLGERIRELLLHSDDQTPIGRRAEMLLYMAARAQMVDEIIRPALEAGKTVVSDRYVLANLVYQGHAGGLEIETIRTVGSVATARNITRRDLRIGFVARGRRSSTQSRPSIGWNAKERTIASVCVMAFSAKPLDQAAKSM